MVPPELRPRLVLLDRDGVLNRNLAGGVRSVADWEWLPGAVSAVRRLSRHRIRLMVVSNQAGIGRGLLTVAELERIHRHMLRGLGVPDLALADVLYCPHRPEDRCGCRKPEPGMIHTALERTGVPPEDALLVGDHVSDLRAAGRAGCRSIHVRSGRGTQPDEPLPYYLGSVTDLLTATESLTPR